MKKEIINSRKKIDEKSLLNSLDKENNLTSKYNHYKLNLTGVFYNSKIFLLIIFSVIILISSFISAQVIWSDDSDTEFYTGSNLPICIINSPTSSLWSAGGISTDAMDDCYDENGIDSNGNSKTSCCPSGYTCNQQTGSCEVSSIQPPPPAATSCADYSREQCGNYPLTEDIKNFIEERANKLDSDGNLIKFCHNDPYVNSEEGICLYLGNCMCKWNEAIGKCDEKFLNGNPCATDINDQDNLLTCETTTNQVQDKCNTQENIITLSWTGTLRNSIGSVVVDSDNICRNGYKDFPCPVKSTLPFFGFFNLIISLGIIYVAYFVFRKKIRFV